MSLHADTPGITAKKHTVFQADDTVLTSARTAAYGPVRARLNNHLLWCISIIIATAPFLYGSNRPLLWCLWAIVLCATGLWWFLSMAKANIAPRIVVRDAGCVLLPFLLLAIYMAVQIMPLGALVPPFQSTTDPSALIISRTLSLTPDDTVLALMRWLSYGLLFYFVLQICGNSPRTHKFIHMLHWGIVVHAALALVFFYQLGDTTFGIDKLTYKGPATGGFVNRNSFATFLALGAILGVVRALQINHDTTTALAGRRSFFDLYWDRSGIVPIAMGWLVIMLALVASNSRMGVFAACCGMFTVLAMSILTIPAKAGLRSLMFGLTIIPLTIGIGVLLYGRTFLERLGQLETSDDLDVRLTLYRQTVQMIESRPWLGFGGQSYEFAFPLFHEPTFAPHLLWDKAHSTYLTLWTEYGVIFGSLPILMVGYIFYSMLMSTFRRELPDYAMFAGLGAIVTAAVHSLVDFSLEIQAVNFVFIAIIAAGYARVLDSNATGQGA